MKQLTPKQRRALTILAARKKKADLPWYTTSFPAQLAFIRDPAKLKAGLCTRRAGKSTGVGELCLEQAYTNPGVSIGVIGKTRESIKRIYFKDIIKPICQRLGWVENDDYWINKTELSIELKNGSVIYFAGADANEDEMNKFLGQKFFLVVIDEASMYANIDLKMLVHEILEPAVADYEGTIIMIGTPSNYINSYYHKVTSGEKEASRWSVHKWSWKDNPHVVRQNTKLIDDMLRDNPDIINDPGFKQHWLGEWQVEMSSRVYKYDPKINSIPFELPRGYQTVMGVDLGYEDDSAFVIGAWSHYDTVLHVVHAEAHKGMDLDAVEAKMKQLQARFGVGMITIDGAGKQFVETLQTRFGMSLHRAEKIQKKDFIELFNTDLLFKRINVVASECKQLISEWEELVWDQDKRDKGEWKELRTKPNHLADAALYMWRWCYNFAAIPKTKPLNYEDQMEKDLNDKMEQKDNDRIQYVDSDLSW